MQLLQTEAKVHHVLYMMITQNLHKITHFLLMAEPHLKCTLQARIFWVGLLTDVTHTNESF
jgi:hypothetical protein